MSVKDKPWNAVERMKLIRTMYESGMSMTAVGEHLGLSRQRVQTLLAEAGVPRRPRGSNGVRRQPLTERYTPEFQQSIVEAYQQGMSRRLIARTFSVSVYAVATVLDAHLSKDEVNDRRRKQATRQEQNGHLWSDAALVRALQDCAKDMGPDFGTMKYAKWREEGTRIAPSVALFLTRKPADSPGTRATWNEWKELAGLPVKATASWVQFSDGDLYKALGRVKVKLGHFPSIAEYDANRWKREPKAGAIRRRHSGRWGLVREAFAEWEAAQ